MKKENVNPILGPNYINRELSWLEFNDRVLEEARDKNNPLLERLKFLAITASNLDEFFMIRVASLKDLVNAQFSKPDSTGMTPVEQLKAVAERTQQMVSKQYASFSRSLLPALAKQQINFRKPADLTESQVTFLDNYFRSTLFPILTPMAVDASRPFPLLANKTINLIVPVKKVKLEEAEDALITGTEVIAEHHTDFALIQVPTVVSRVIELPCLTGIDLILLEDVIRMHLNQLFSGITHGQAYCFRIMRNADFDLEEDDAADLLKEIEKQLKMRQWGQVIRLEAEHDIDPQLLKILKHSFSIHSDDTFLINGPLDLTVLFKLMKLPLASDSRFPIFEPQVHPDLTDKDLFASIRQQDVLLHHPYESFSPVIDFIRQAAEDPDVLAIKQTLYRVSGQSPIIRHLATAAEKGKQVLVLVELKARFDEENNIQWAKKLEQAGCHVIYGLVGLKTHSKITLVVRRDEDRIRRYVHLGTGNYNDITAGIYTDLGLLTCNEGVGADASEFFNMLSGYSAPLTWHKLIMAPFWMRQGFVNRIERERRHAQIGKKARIIAKINSLVDPELISLLYKASQAGVQIDLIVRGICCLRPGVAGLSENITVRSLVGRFLEHSRIFYFYNDGEEDIYLASADWMPRNLDRRVELMFPIEDRVVWDKVYQILETQLNDTERAWLLDSSGQYTRVDRRGKMHLDSQQHFCEQAISAAQGFECESASELLVPVRS